MGGEEVLMTVLRVSCVHRHERMRMVCSSPTLSTDTLTCMRQRHKGESKVVQEEEEPLVSLVSKSLVEGQ